LESFIVVSNRSDHEFSHKIRVMDGDIQSDACSHAITEDIGFLDIELPEKSDCMVRHLFYGQRAIYVDSAPMGLLLYSNDLPVSGKGWR
jgi:hypothetical protein